MPGAPPQPSTSEPPAPPAAGAPAPRAADPADPLASLKHMSTTAGVGTGEYVAINPVAVVALLLGLASVLTLMHEVMLVIPLAGIVCSVVAWRQIRNSNGTQAGTPLAVAGLVLSLLLGGSVFAREAIGGWARRDDQRVMQQMIHRLGDDLSTGRYDDAYTLFSGRFKARIPPARFRDGFEELRRRWEVGGIQSMEWNGRAEFEEDVTGSGMQAAWVGAVPRFEKPTETLPRWQIQFVKVGGQWQIEDFPDIFPPEKKPRKR